MKRLAIILLCLSPIFVHAQNRPFPAYQWLCEALHTWLHSDACDEEPVRAITHDEIEVLVSDDSNILRVLSLGVSDDSEGEAS